MAITTARAAPGTARETIEAYFASHGDASRFLAQDVEFLDLTRPDEPIIGRDAVSRWLDRHHGESFTDTFVEPRATVTGTDAHTVVVEFTFHGRHARTHRDVQVPMSCTYEVEDGRIRRARLYYDPGAFTRQLGLAP